MSLMNHIILRLRGVSVSSQAQIASKKIGKGTKIWQFTIVGREVEIGESCNIGAHVFIESGVKIGNRVTIKNGAMIWSGVTLGDDVFVGPGVCFTNAKNPMPGRMPSDLTETKVSDFAVIGANSTILSGLEIGESSVVGAGSVVTRIVKKGETVFGNPAKPSAR